MSASPLQGAAPECSCDALGMEAHSPPCRCHATTCTHARVASRLLGTPWPIIAGGPWGALPRHFSPPSPSRRRRGLQLARAAGPSPGPPCRSGQGPSPTGRAATRLTGVARNSRAALRCETRKRRESRNENQGCTRQGPYGTKPGRMWSLSWRSQGCCSMPLGA